MSQTTELGNGISKAQFKEAIPALHIGLLALQRELKKAGIPVVIVVSGVEGAGKGEVVNRLNQWFDARGVTTYAFWEHSDEERERPFYWRFWRALPPKGKISIMFGSWYTQAIIDRVFGVSRKGEYDSRLIKISKHEKMLVDDGTLLIKLWFHLPKEAQRKKLKKEALKEHQRISPLLKRFSKRYDRFKKVSEHAIQMTDQDCCPWHVIDATDKRHRDLAVGHLLLTAIEQRLKSTPVTTPPEPLESESRGKMIKTLDQLNRKKTLSDDEYRRSLPKYQRELYQLAWRAKARKRSAIIVFEGWDASGKGGAIRRLTAAMDARLYKTIAIASPSDEEKAHHYLWRFWRHIPRDGYVTIYDRSWYGRVLVERVEEFTKTDDWQRAYREINEFETQLREDGICLIKFWIHIGKEEQLKRFRERKKIPWKKHKITEEDWRNRAKWDAYKTAVGDMLAQTSTERAPWNLIPGNDKKYARLAVLKTVCERLEETIRSSK